MANETVSFEITANTQNAGKAITELQRKLNDIARIKTDDKGAKAQQKVFAQINKDLEGILEKEGQLGRHYNTYSSRAKRIETLTKEYEAQDAVLQKFVGRQSELQAKEADGTITPSEVNELSRVTATVNNLTENQANQLKKINATKRENEKLDRSGKAALNQIVSKYGEIRTDESNILGLKLEQVKNTEQVATAEDKLNREVNKTNSSLDKQTQSAKRAKNEFDKVTNKANRTPNIKQIVNEAEVKDLQVVLQETAAITNRINEAMNTEPATNNIAELIRRLNELSVAKKTLEELNLPAGTDATYNKIIQLIAVLNGQVSNYKKQLTGVAEKHEKTKKSGTDFTKSVLSGVKSLKSAMSKLDRVGNKVKSSFNSMAHSMKSNFKHLITSITKYVLGFRSLFFLVRRLRKYLGEGIQNLAQFNDGNNIVNESITDMLSSLLFLKNAWAAAFSPIITFVRPMLVKLIDDLAEVGNAVARFMSALLGQEVAFNAVRVRAKDYADSLDNVGGSASGAADKTKKLTDRLAAFDDLNVLGIDRDPDATGSGGGGGLADEYVPDPNEMFKIVDPEENGFLKMLKDAWEKADFSAVGATIKDKIIAQLQGIDWGNIQGTGIKIGSSFGSFIAGLFGDPELFKEVGKTIAEGFNTITYSVKAFLDQIEGVDFGGNLAEGFNTFLKTTDWQTAGENISRTFSMITTNINAFLDTIDDEELEKSIHDFVTSLDIPKMLYDAGKTTIKLLGKLTIIAVDIIKALGESLGDDLILYAQAKVKVTQLTQTGYDENGDPIEIPVYIEPEYDWKEHPLKALLDKLLLDVGQLGVDVVFNIQGEEDFNTFADGWLKIFGEDGDFFKVIDVIAGVVQGNPGKWITAVFGDSQDLEDLRTGLDGILAILRPLDAFVLADLFRDVDFSEVKESFEGITSEDFWNSVWEDIWGTDDPDDDGSSGRIAELETSWNGLEESADKTHNKVKGSFQALDTDLGTIWDNITLVAGTTATTLHDTLSTKWNEIKGNTYEKWVGIKSNITEKFTEAKDQVEEKIETFKTTITSKWQEIKGNIYEKLVGIKTNIITVFDQIKDGIKNPINGFLDNIELMVNKAIDGINNLIGVLNELPDIKFTNPFTGTEYALGFSLPTLSHIDIPHLAQGAVIPPNREFMAVLGDQSNGTNIEAPLDTIKQAVAEVMANNGNAEMIQLLQQLITVVENKNLVIGDKEIGRANARYVKQQNIVRGATF